MSLVHKGTTPRITHHHFVDGAGVVHVGVRDGLLTMTKCGVMGTLQGYTFVKARPLMEYPLDRARVVTCITCGYLERPWFR